MKVEYSNGRVGAFRLALSGWKINDAQGNDALMWTVSGKQSGDVNWTIAADSNMTLDKAA